MTECRRCAGRGQRVEEDKPCFLCLGKGNISISPKEIAKFFKRFRPAETQEEIKS